MLTLYDDQLSRARNVCTKQGGWEKPSAARPHFQVWIVDFHPDGYGTFGR